MNIAWIFLLLTLGINIIAGGYVFYRKKLLFLDIAIEVNNIHVKDSSTKMDIAFTIYNNLDGLFYLRNEASLLTNDGYRIPFFITTGNSRFIIPPKQSQAISVVDINFPKWSKRQFINNISIENTDGHVYKANIPRQIRKSVIEQQVISMG